MNFYRVVLPFALLGLIWGGAFVAIKVVVTAMPPFHAAALRLWISVFFLWIAFKATRQKIQIPQKYWTRSWLAGLLMIGVPYAFLFWGEMYVSAAVAGVINGTVPLWVAMMTSFPHSPLHEPKEKISRSLLIALGLGFIGLVIISYPEIRWSGSAKEMLGLGAVVCMALCYSVSNILNARLLGPDHQISLSGNVFHQHIISMIFLTILAPLMEDGPVSWSAVLTPSAIGGLLYLGVLSGATCLLLYYYLLRKIGTVRTSAVIYLIPLAAVLLDSLYFQHLPSLPTLLGALFIVAGIFFLRTRNVKKPVEVPL